MSFVFHIRPISEDEGFEIDWEGALQDPLECLKPAAKGAMLDRDLDAEIQILGLDALPVEMLNLDHQLVLAARNSSVGRAFSPAQLACEQRFDNVNYSPEPPLDPGYYWLKADDVEEIVEVWVNDGDLDRRLFIHRCGDGNCCEINTVTNGLWAGPILRPL